MEGRISFMLMLISLTQRSDVLPRIKQLGCRLQECGQPEPNEIPAQKT
jgi:hypothetical protein